jgi:hypothetical protein
MGFLTGLATGFASGIADGMKEARQDRAEMLKTAFAQFSEQYLATRTALNKSVTETAKAISYARSKGMGDAHIQDYAVLGAAKLIEEADMFSKPQQFKDASGYKPKDYAAQDPNTIGDPTEMATAAQGTINDGQVPQKQPEGFFSANPGNAEAKAMQKVADMHGTTPGQVAGTIMQNRTTGATSGTPGAGTTGMSTAEMDAIPRPKAYSSIVLDPPPNVADRRPVQLDQNTQQALIREYAAKGYTQRKTFNVLEQALSGGLGAGQMPAPTTAAPTGQPQPAPAAAAPAAPAPTGPLTVKEFAAKLRENHPNLSDKRVQETYARYLQRFNK